MPEDKKADKFGMGEAAKKQTLSKKLSLKDVLEALVMSKFVGKDFAKEIYTKHKDEKRHPLELLAQFGIRDRRDNEITLKIDKLTEWYANYLGIPYIKIVRDDMVVKDIITNIPKQFCIDHQILPVLDDGKKAVIAMADPYCTDWVKELSAMIKRQITMKMAAPTQIDNLTDYIYDKHSNITNIASRNKSAFADPRLEELEQLIDRAMKSANRENDDSVIKICDWLLNYSYSERASDIHLEPKKNSGKIRFRIDGKLQTIYDLEPEMMLHVVSRLKILGHMKLDERRKPQDGRIKRFLDNGRKVELRLSTVPANYGEKMVIRIFDQQVAGTDLSAIGFNENDEKLWNKLIHEKQGLILVTGPTGSGKTTTLFTSMNIIATPEVNITTIEDPIEMTLDTVNQVQVNHQIEMGFAQAVRAFLRQDPDVIMVGEIRDYDTGEVALQASLTGHLVFSTLHTNGALATIQRLIDIGLPTFLINSALRAVLAQRLVRKLCPNCKQKVPTPKDKWLALVDGHQEVCEMPEYVYEAKGCDSCKHLGYMGRIVVYELIEYKDEIKKLIHKDIELSQLRESAKGLYRSIRHSCAEKVAKGETSLEEAISVAY
jgi:general secretion pathway protein E